MWEYATGYFLRILHSISVWRELNLLEDIFKSFYFTYLYLYLLFYTCRLYLRGTHCSFYSTYLQNFVTCYSADVDLFIPDIQYDHLIKYDTLLHLVLLNYPIN